MKRERLDAMAGNSYVNTKIGSVEVDIEHRNGEVEIASITGEAGSYEYVGLPRSAAALRELGQLLIATADQIDR